MHDAINRRCHSQIYTWRCLAVTDAFDGVIAAIASLTHIMQKYFAYGMLCLLHDELFVLDSSTGSKV